MRYRSVLDVLGRHWVSPPDVSRQFSGVIFKVPKFIRFLERWDTRYYQKVPEIPVLQAVFRAAFQFRGLLGNTSYFDAASQRKRTEASLTLVAKNVKTPSI
jgi:hypothetical protein